MIAGWSSLVARRAHNPEVGGSNPSPATEKPSHLRRLFSHKPIMLQLNLSDNSYFLI